MKRFLLFALFAAALPSLAGAQEWLLHYNEAVGKAKAENKPVVVNFTGSDWCAPCMRWDRELFELKTFKDYAAKNLVLLKLDYPVHKRVPADLKEQNEKLREEFQVEEFPTVLVLNSQGHPMGRFGYTSGGLDRFVAELKKAEKVR